MLTDLDWTHLDDLPNHSPVFLKGKLNTFKSPGRTMSWDKSRDGKMQEQGSGLPSTLIVIRKKKSAPQTIVANSRYIQSRRMLWSAKLDRKISWEQLSQKISITCFFQSNWKYLRDSLSSGGFGTSSPRWSPQVQECTEIKCPGRRVD